MEDHDVVAVVVKEVASIYPSLAVAIVGKKIKGAL